MKKILLSSLLALGTGLSAQVAGTKIIGTDYPTLAAALADLNINGVASGGVTLNVPAGYTETAPVGGFLLGSAALNASLSGSNPLVIQKSGSGLNPLFTGNTGSTTNLDAIFKFSGVDYMTLDGIDLQENTSNTTSTTLNERGFAFYVLNATDGCNYNTIKNSTITFLKTVNNNAIGIYFGHTLATSTAIINPTSITGSHSFNKIYSNTIVKSLGNAILFTGYAAPSPYTLYDQGNDIGGDTVATGNTISDAGGYAGTGSYITTNYGINCVSQNNTKISNNTINFSPNGKGTVGIYASGINCTYTTNNNIINATGQSDGDFGSQHAGISTSGAGLNLTANNNIINVSATMFPNAPFGTTSFGIWAVSTGGAGVFSATGNTITSSGTDAAYGLFSNVTGGSVNLTKNTVRNIIATGNASGIQLNNTGLTTNVSINKISNVISNSSAGSAYGLYVGGSAASTTNIFNNLIGDIKTPISTSTSSTTFRLAGIYLAAFGANSNLNLYYNTIYLNATSGGSNFNSAGIYHTYNVTPTTAALDLRNNLIVNTSTSSGTGTGIACAFRRNSAADLSNYATTSNNNDFAVGPAGFVYSQGTPGPGVTTTYDLAAFKALVESREVNSISAIAQFISTAGTDFDFLKLDGSGSTNASIDNKGSFVTGYPTDFAGIDRNAATPDIGAYEFTYLDPTLAISDLNKKNISVYPNPFTDALTISDVQDVKIISVSDMTGRQIRTLAPSSTFNLANLKTGLYIVNVQMVDGSIKSFKVIKK